MALPGAVETLETDRGETIVESVVGQPKVLASPPEDVLSLGIAPTIAIENGDRAFGKIPLNRRRSAPHTAMHGQQFVPWLIVDVEHLHFSLKVVVLVDDDRAFMHRVGAELCVQWLIAVVMSSKALALGG